jgi:hypothetical protein
MVDQTGHAPTRDNPVSANPQLNTWLNSTWGPAHPFVGCACAGLDQEVQAANKAQHRSPLQAFGNFAAGLGSGLVGFFEAATPMGQANLTLNNPVPAMVTQRIPVVRDVAGWVADRQASGAYDQAAKTLGAVGIDQSRVNTEVVDLWGGFPGMPGMLSNWAQADQEVLIGGLVPPEASFFP